MPIDEDVVEVKQASGMMKYAKDAVYWLAIIGAALSNMFLDKTDSQSTDTDHENRIKKLEIAAKEHGAVLASQNTHIAVTSTNVGNIEQRMGTHELKLN